MADQSFASLMAALQSNPGLWSSLTQPVSSIGMSGNMAQPQQQQRVFPTPPYYSGPGDNQLEVRRPLPPDRNTFDPGDVQTYRTYRNDIPERT